MLYQLGWKILPGLRGLSCSEFRAVPIPPGAGPENEQGAVVECASAAERDALLRELESHFGPQRFSNNAAAFESVKAFVLAQAGRK